MRVIPKWDGALLLSMLRNLNRHSSDERGPAPNKPIVLFLAIQRLRESGSSVLIYEREFSLIRALINYFDNKDTPGADYPFWYLQNDKLFDVSYIPPLQFRKGKEFPPHSALIKSKAVGKLPFWTEQLLRKDSELCNQTLRYLATALLGVDLDVIENVYVELSSKK